MNEVAAVNGEPTVFIVDDDPAVLRLLSASVEAVFPHVESFGSAAEFLAAFDPERPGCLVLDVAMPGMSGLELQHKLANDEIELPIIFLTGHGNVQMAVGAMQAGAINFLEKPLREQELWESIRSAIDRDERHRRHRSRRETIDERFAQLTPGERAVFDLIVEGKFNKDIAEILKLSVRTVEDRRARLMKKMEAGTVANLVQMAMTR